MKNSTISQEVLSVLKSVNKDQKNPLPLHEPTFAGNEWKYVKDCLDTGWVSSVGDYVDQFENKLAEFTGIKRAVAVVNGTAALHMSLLLSGVKSNDEVLTPTLSFVATANAITYCGAVPHFVDSCEATLGVDPVKLDDYLKEISEIKNNSTINKNTGRTIRCLVVMHTLGHPVDLDPILELCNKYHLSLIEDTAESIGSYYKGKHTGNWGKISAISFNGNKTITTGGGGAILTNDDSLADLAKHLTTTAKIPHLWEFGHDQIVYNYRLPNINAALGVAQMEQLPILLNKKTQLAALYNKLFAHVNGLRFVIQPPHTISNYWLNTILLDRDNCKSKDEILKLTNENGIMTRPAWKLMHQLPMFVNCPQMDLSQSEDLENRIINIPSSPNLI